MRNWLSGEPASHAEKLPSFVPNDFLKSASVLLMFPLKKIKKSWPMSSQCLHRWKLWEALNDFSRKLLGRGGVSFLTVPLHISRKNLFKFCGRKRNRITALPLFWKQSKQHFSCSHAGVLQSNSLLFLSPLFSFSGSWGQEQHFRLKKFLESMHSKSAPTGPMFVSGKLEEYFFLQLHS